MLSNPFTSDIFFEALKESASIGPGTGWTPLEIEENGAKLVTYIKNHSYGEYIFDWAWAEAYERHGLDYYPKLTAMVPFTPVSTRHFQNANEQQQNRILEKHENYLKEGPFSGAHFLYLSQDETPLLKKENYLIRNSLQYHFHNPGYTDFEDFLKVLKTKKAKNLKKERNIPGITIQSFTGHQLTEIHADRMYDFYISTIEKKRSFDYLNRKFFRIIFNTLKDQILYVEAQRNNTPIGASLFFYDDVKLYGRYWGATEFVENLHFELCYYQGIDFCIKNKLQVFEAGAQGEHKIARGFVPTIIFSAHKLKHSVFQNAIRDFIEKEKNWVNIQIEELNKGLPFK